MSVYYFNIIINSKRSSTILSTNKMTISFNTGQSIPVEDSDIIVKTLKDAGATVVSTYLNKGEVEVAMSIVTGDETFLDLAIAMAELEFYYRNTNNLTIT